jgi:hypothetical protein
MDDNNNSVVVVGHQFCYGLGCHFLLQYASATTWCGLILRYVCQSILLPPFKSFHLSFVLVAIVVVFDSPAFTVFLSSSCFILSRTISLKQNMLLLASLHEETFSIFSIFDIVDVQMSSYFCLRPSDLSLSSNILSRALENNEQFLLIVCTFRYVLSPFSCLLLFVLNLISWLLSI